MLLFVTPVALSPLVASGQELPTTRVLTSSQSALIDHLVTRQMLALKIPGVSVELAVLGRPIYRRAFGVRAPGKATDNGTVFPIGSITKQFTAACGVLLAEEHRVDLDSPVSKYVPLAPHGTVVTVRELLDQTSGLPDYSAQPQLQVAIGKNKLNHLLPGQLLDMIRGKPLNFTPGTQFDYSNTNYVLAGMIVQAASGESYEDFLNEHILGPLGMHQTQYLSTSIPQGRDVSHGYQVTAGRLKPLRTFTMSWAGPAGALASNTDNLVKWDEAFFGGRVVSSHAVKVMATAVKSDYGYGWVVDTVHGDSRVWHNGGLPGAHAMNAYFPKSSLEIVILTNLLDANPEGLAKEIYAEVEPLLESQATPLNTSGSPSPSPKV